MNDQGSNSHFTAYCVDLTHEMSVSGNVYGTDPGNFATVFSPTVANEVGFLLNLDTTKGIGGATISQSLGEGAVQLAIWSDIDPNFQATNFSSTALGDLYAYYQGLSRGNLNGQQYGVGYLEAEHVGNLYQSLAYATGTVGPATATPEPSGLVLGLVGAVATVSFMCKRRASRPMPDSRSGLRFMTPRLRSQLGGAASSFPGRRVVDTVDTKTENRRHSYSRGFPDVMLE